MAERKPEPAPTLSVEVLARLRPRFDAIGPWQAHAADDGSLIEWENPPALAALGCRAAVEFEVETETGDRDPDERMLDLWDQFYRHWERHAADLRREMVGVFRENQPHFFPVEREQYPADLPDDAIMQLVRATVRVQRLEDDDETLYDLTVSFAAAWDGEHSWDFDYDADAGTLVAPWK